jgi:sugar phosphate isomerase/epimerase
MKLSFSTLATPTTDISGIVKLASQFGYQGVDLRVADNFGELTPKATSAQISHVKNLFEAENLQVAGLFCYNKAGTEDQASWGVMESSIIDLLDLAGKLGSPSIRIGTGNPRNAVDVEDYYKRTAEVINNVLAKDKSAIQLHIQNHSGAYDVTQSYKLVTMVNNPRFRMAFAPEHCIIENENLEDVFAKAKEITAQLHVSDIIKEDQKFPEVLPGQGITPIKEAYEAIGGKDFTGWVTFKWEKQWNPELMPAEEALPKFIEYAKKNF